MDPSTLGPVAIAQVLVVFVLQWLKKAAWFPWLTQNSGTASRIVAYAIGFLHAAGITWAYNSAQGQLIVNGLMLAAILQALYTAGAAMAANEVTYLLVQIHEQSTSTGREIGAPPIAEPPAVPVADKPKSDSGVR